TGAGQIDLTADLELSGSRTARCQRSGHPAVDIAELRPRRLRLIERLPGAGPAGDLVDGISFRLRTFQRQVHDGFRRPERVPKALTSLYLARGDGLALGHRIGQRHMCLDGETGHNNDEAAHEYTPTH